jgi:hypothetical protein
MLPIRNEGLVTSAVSTVQGLQAAYGDRVAADLQHNSEERERISGQVAALQAQLEELEGERQMLLSVQQAILSSDGRQNAVRDERNEQADAPAPSTASTSSTSSPRLPRSRKAESAERPKTSAGRKSAAKKRETKKPETKKPEKAQKVTDLVESRLAEHGEPQSAAEVAAAVSTKERPVTVISVRTALEGLVRRSAAYRSKQGRAVYYEAVAKDGKGGPAGKDAPDDQK